LQQVASDSTTMESTLQITISICFSTFHWTLPKNDDGLGIVVPKLKNTLFYMPNRFLEAFVKFKQFDSDSTIMENT